MKYLKTYDCGLRVAYEYIPTVRSAAIGVMVATGSIYEDGANSGISHFIEHMLFKGTKRRTALEIVDETDKIGARMNAYTAKTATCYYTYSLMDDLDICSDILSDMYFNSLFNEEEMAKEKKVVIEEIAMCEDDFEDLCIENGTQLLFKGHALEKPILGTKETVAAFTREQILDYMESHYVAENTVISVSGNVTEDKLNELIDKYFLPFFADKKHRFPDIGISKGTGGEILKFKDIEQGNLAIMFPTCGALDDGYNSLLIMDCAFGGSMSSRLFQHIREQLGLAYSVYSSASFYKREGYYTIYIGANKDNVEKAVAAVKDEIAKMVKDGITKEEFDKSKVQIKASAVYGQESVLTVMRANAKNVITYGTMFDVDEKLAQIAAVTQKQVNEQIKALFNTDKMVVSYVGPALSGTLLNILKD